MTTEELDRLKELAERATPTGWCVDYCHDGLTGMFWRSEGPIVENRDQCIADAEYIAAVSPDVVLKLIAEVKEKATPDGVITSMSEGKRLVVMLKASNEKLRAQLAEAREALRFYAQALLQLRGLCARWNRKDVGGREMTKEELKQTIRCVHKLWYGTNWTSSPAHAMKLHRHMEALFNFAGITSSLVENNPDEVSPAQFNKEFGIKE